MRSGSLDHPFAPWYVAGRPVADRGFKRVGGPCAVRWHCPGTAGASAAAAVGPWQSHKSLTRCKTRGGRGAVGRLFGWRVGGRGAVGCSGGWQWPTGDRQTTLHTAHRTLHTTHPHTAHSQNQRNATIFVC
jgi:hypothetical protein